MVGDGNLDTDSVWSSRRDWRFLQTEYLRKVRDPGGFLSKTIHFLWLCKLDQNQTCFLIWNTYSMNVLFRQCFWWEHFGGIQLWWRIEVEGISTIHRHHLSGKTQYPWLALSKAHHFLIKNFNTLHYWYQFLAICVYFWVCVTSSSRWNVIWCNQYKPPTDVGKIEGW